MRKIILLSLTFTVCTCAIAQPYLPLAGGTLTGNLKINGTEGAWAENLLLIKPSGWGGVRFARNDPSTNNFDGNWAIGYNGNTGNDFSISSSTGGSQYNYLFHISSATRNIGIHTNSPATPLDVQGAVLLGGSGTNLDPAATPTLPLGVGSGKLLVGWNYASGEAETDFISDRIGSYTGGFRFYDHTASATTCLMTITGSGNVGIGTITAPSQKLHVYSPYSANTWNGRGVFGNENSVAIIGTYNNNAVVGAHNAALNGWQTLYLNTTNGIDGGYVTIGNRVGIGTTSPQAKLDVIGQVRIADGTQALNRVLTCDGNGIATWRDPQGGSGTSQWLSSGQNISYGAGSVGIGTVTPNNILTVNGSQSLYSNLDLYTTFHRIAVVTGPGVITLGDDDDVILSGGAVYVNASTGNVLIGKSTQQNTIYKLDVAGNVRANKLTVNTTGADFVFEPSYKLKPLAEVEDFVKQNKHLPGITPSAEMQKDGVEVGESQTKLLQKIEELTLYMIEIKKENEKLQEKNQQLEKRMEVLERQETKGSAIK